jgi:hypothetical protein
VSIVGSTALTSLPGLEQAAKTTHAAMRTEEINARSGEYIGSPSASRRECTADRLYESYDVDIAARVDDQVSVFGEWVPGCSELVLKYGEIGFRGFVFARCTFFDA